MTHQLYLQDLLPEHLLTVLLLPLLLVLLFRLMLFLSLGAILLLLM